MALFLVLTACVPEPEKAAKDVRLEKYSPLTLDCIFIHTIDSWKYLDPYHVIIYAPSRAHAYLLELSTYCQPLQYAEAVGIASHQDGRLCARDRDALLVRDLRCSIATILPYKMAEDANAAATPAP